MRVLRQILRLGDQLVQVGPVVRYWAVDPAEVPHGWGFRINFTLLFPR